jgi:alanyl-tRNA synthetase
MKYPKWRMTRRLYYTDSYLQHFRARLLGQSEASGGWRVVLDCTAFYPGSGGQPNDVGMIEGIEVYDVSEDDRGQVFHCLRQAIQQQGEVHGAIDWGRRFDHMQQHSGQHILSQAFVRTSNLNTIGFHMGPDWATIDLDTEVLTREQTNKAEDLANITIYENRPVRIRLVSPEEVSSLGLRKASQREGPLRIVEVHDFDVSACGGTHVGTTGEIGGILIRKVERINRQARVSFVCGRRIIGAHRSDLDVLDATARKFSAGYLELPQRVERQMEECKQLKKTLQEKNKQLSRFLAGKLYAEMSIQAGFRIIRKTFENEEFEFVKLLAQSLVSCGPCIALLANKSDQAQLVFATSECLSFDLRPIMGECCKILEGKGGGSHHLVQGGGKRVSHLQTALDWAESQIQAQQLPSSEQG